MSVLRMFYNNDTQYHSMHRGGKRGNPREHVDNDVTGLERSQQRGSSKDEV